MGEVNSLLIVEGWVGLVVGSGCIGGWMVGWMYGFDRWVDGRGCRVVGCVGWIDRCLGG